MRQSYQGSTCWRMCLGTQKTVGKVSPAQDPMSDESLALRLDCKLGDVMTYVVQEFGLLVCHLRCDVESVVINKPIDIETLEVVQRVIVRDMVGNERIPKYWNEVCRAKDTVDMDDCENGISTVIEIRSNHPHPCVLIWLLGDATEPVN